MIKWLDSNQRLPLVACELWSFTMKRDTLYQLSYTQSEIGGYRGLRSLRLMRDRHVGYYYFIYPRLDTVLLHAIDEFFVAGCI